MLYKLVVSSLLAGIAAAKTIQIEVGKSGLTFSPDSVTAAKGDILEFHFSKYEHSVAAGPFDDACSPSNNGFYSGFVKANGDNPSVFLVTVNNTDPLFYYCSVGRHCQDGMVGVVNPSSSQTLDSYKNAAKKADDNESPDSPSGGKLVKESEAKSSASSMSSSASSSSTASSSPSSSSSASSTASSSSSKPSQTNAAVHMRASLGGLAGAAAGVAAVLM